MNELPHRYQTVLALSQGEYKDRGSRFIAHLMPIKNQNEVKALIDRLWEEHPKARHVCFAYRLGFDGNNVRSSDDGEPSGTAGKPILNQLQSAKLTFVLAAVVRYFGGIKLGPTGLIQAYKTSTQAAIEKAEIHQREVIQMVHIQCTYHILGSVLSFTSKHGLKIEKMSYGDFNNFWLAIPLLEATQTLQDLEAYLNHQHNYTLTSDDLKIILNHLE